ncbi:hypothetical protein BX616_005064 [Lobosporangium transversale]|nr:hypothetical protein BX616_005064 [Lobosporangium transversale]
MSTRQSRTADKSTNDKHTRILKKLLQKPENKFCVDCRKKDPRWASFNLGCFMCIRCSGVHRSMGTHITKVKSVDLDSWTPEQVENMIKWGNEKANMYWEARLPANSIPNESTSGIDPWIRSKYEHKQFARKGSFPDPSELGPIDEAMLMELYGKSDSQSRPQAQMNRSKDTSGSFAGNIAPPPANPTRSSFPKPAASPGLQGADLFSIGQRSASPAKPAQASAAPVDFFGLNDSTPAQSTQVQAPKLVSGSATQDLFSITSTTNQPSAPSSNNGPQAAKPVANTDWKNSIMSLYGNQSSAPKPNTGGFNSAPFGQLQGIDAFGFGQPQQQQQQQRQQQQQQQQQQQHNPWGNDDGFGDMQQASAPAPSASSFDIFGMGSSTSNANNNNINNNNNFFGANNNNGFGKSLNNGFGPQNGSNGGGGGVPQGGDLFSMIADATKSPVASPPPSNNKNNRFEISPQLFPDIDFWYASNSIDTLVYLFVIHELL